MSDGEERVTWTPNPKRGWPTVRLIGTLWAETPEDASYGARATSHGPGMRFVPDGQGGGTLYVWSKQSLRWRVKCTVRRHGA